MARVGRARAWPLLAFSLQAWGAFRLLRWSSERKRASGGDESREAEAAFDRRRNRDQLPIDGALSPDVESDASAFLITIGDGRPSRSMRRGVRPEDQGRRGKDVVCGDGTDRRPMTVRDAGSLSRVRRSGMCHPRQARDHASCRLALPNPSRYATV